MTVEQAAKILSEMYRRGREKGEAVTQVHLLEIKFADEIGGSPLKEIAVRAGIPETYRTGLKSTKE
jgi:hypothetical protein